MAEGGKAQHLRCSKYDCCHLTRPFADVGGGAAGLPVCSGNGRCAANPLRTGGELGFCVCLKIKTHFFEVFVSDGVDGLWVIA